MDIAYQVFGDGPVDLVVLPGPFIPVDSIDDEPSLYRFHRRLASFARVIRFDQRGMGLSSRAPSVDLMGPRSWAEDAVAVMDAAGCEQATIFGSGFTAMTGLVLAAERPERVRSLVIVNGAARVLRAPDYPVGAEAIAADPFSSLALDPDAVERVGMRRDVEVIVGSVGPTAFSARMRKGCAARMRKTGEGPFSSRRSPTPDVGACYVGVTTPICGGSRTPGSATWKVAPWSGLAVAHRRPPWRSTMERLMDSPMPRPPGFVV